MQCYSRSQVGKTVCRDVRSRVPGFHLTLGGQQVAGLGWARVTGAINLQSCVGENQERIR